jgi:hypothetical protein
LAQSYVPSRDLNVGKTEMRVKLIRSTKSVKHTTLLGSTLTIKQTDKENSLK